MNTPLVPAVTSKLLENNDYIDQEPPTPMPSLQTETFDDVLPNLLLPIDNDLWLSDDDDIDLTTFLIPTISPLHSPVHEQLTNPEKLDLIPSSSVVKQPDFVTPKTDWEGFKIPKVPPVTSKYFSKNPPKELATHQAEKMIPNNGQNLLGTASTTKNQTLSMKPTSKGMCPPSSSKNSRNTSSSSSNNHSKEKPTPSCKKHSLNYKKSISKKQLISPISRNHKKLKKTLHPDLNSFVSKDGYAFVTPSLQNQQTQDVVRVRHFKIPVALCVLREGFTISDGLVACHSKRADVALIARELASYAPSMVILVGERTKKIWDDIKMSYADIFANVGKREFKNNNYSVGECTFCEKELCHRKMAAIGGIGRWKRTPITPIKH